MAERQVWRDGVLIQSLEHDAALDATVADTPEALVVDETLVDSVTREPVEVRRVFRYKAGTPPVNESTLKQQAVDLLADVRAVRRRANGDTGTTRATVNSIAAGTSGLTQANATRALGGALAEVMDGMVVLARVELVLARIASEDFKTGAE